MEINELFTDIETEFIRNIPGLTVNERIDIISMALPDISICAVGGFPIKIVASEPYLLSTKITKEYLATEIRKSLGVSGMLTHANKSNLNLDDMGALCKEFGHLWGYNFMTLTILFNDQHPNVQKAFLRDKRFYESWTVRNDKIYAMTGSIKDFKKFVENRHDYSFDDNTRYVLEKIHNKFGFLWN